MAGGEAALHCVLQWRAARARAWNANVSTSAILETRARKRGMHTWRYILLTYIQMALQKRRYRETGPLHRT